MAGTGIAPAGLTGMPSVVSASPTIITKTRQRRSITAE